MRDDRIDVLKGIWISLIVVAHIIINHLNQIGLTSDTRLIARLPYILGSFSVAGFFAVSGYVLAQSYAGRESFDILLFYKKRLTRIYGPFIVWLAIYKLCWGTLDGYHIVMSLAFLDGWVHFWFLWVIVILYLTFPFVLRMIKNHCLIFMIIAIIAAIFANLFSNSTFFDSYTLNYILDNKILILPANILYFSVGIIIYVYFNDYNLRDRMFPLMSFVIVPMFTIFLWTRINNFSGDLSPLFNLLRTFNELVFNFISILFLIGIVNSLRNRFTLLTSVLSVMGRKSYGIYLSHLAVFYVIRDIVNHLFLSNSMSYLTITILTCLLVLYWTAVSFRNKLTSLLGY